MAIATNTTEGDILIGGDLDPTSTGDMPLLRASGVTPGAYNYSAVGVDGEGNSIIKITKAVIDPKGRITYAKSENYTITSVVATSSTFGIVKVDGTSVTVADGVISSITGSLPVATSTTLGAVKPDNTTVTISGNTLSVNIPAATSSTLGGVRYDNVTMYNGTDGTASVYTATNAVKGLAKPDDVTLKIEDGKLALAKATPYSNGIAKVDAITITFSGTGSSRIFRVSTASDTDFGKVRPDNSTITIENGIISTPVTYATDSVFGIAKADESTLSIADEGTISLAKATNTTKGIIKPDELTVTVNAGVLSVIPARVGYLGTIKPDVTTTSVDASGKISFKIASSSTFGVAKPDNSTITIEAGKLKFSSFSTATNMSLGAARGDNTSVTISSGVLSTPNATSSVLGLVKPDGDTILVNSGVISHNLPQTIATSSEIGLVKPDNSTTTINSGALSALKTTTTTIYDPENPLIPIGLESTLGIAKGDNTTISATGGVLSLVNATTPTFGAVKTDGVTIDSTDGILSTILRQATNSVLGFAKLSDSLVYNSITGKNHAAYATSTTPGITSIDPTKNNLSIYLGTLTDNSVSLDSYNAMPDPQIVIPKNLSGGGTTVLDISTANSSNIFVIKGTSGTLNVDGFLNTSFVEGTPITLICQENAGCTITFSTSATTGFGGFFGNTRSTPISVGSDDTGFTVIQLIIVNIGGLPYGVQVSNTAYSGIRI